MNFKKLLRKQARVILEFGVNLQEDQPLYIMAEPVHRDFVVIITEEAYKMGAKFVDVNHTYTRYMDPRLARVRALYSNEDNLSFTPDYERKRAEEMAKDNWAYLKIVGSEFPNALQNTPANKTNAIRSGWSDATKPMDDKRMAGEMQWCISVAATHSWARQIFPNMDENSAYQKLWKIIFSITRADRDNPVRAWEEHDRMLKERFLAINGLNIKQLRFEDNGTNLLVGLSPKSKFTGGRWTTSSGLPFEPNIPSEEGFTAPDKRKTEGVATTTKPSLINGQLVEGLKVWFENGRVVNFEAEQNGDAFKALIETDAGAPFLGEVALVGVDSPIYQSGLLFGETLLDENAACHIAFGQAYTKCIDGGDDMSVEELKSIGFNHPELTDVHHDIMISSENTRVTAITVDGQEIVLLENGQWQDFS